MQHNSLSKETLNCFSDKTKDKILKESLILFNDVGFNSITTANISKKCKILEGTLWYHFNSKKNLLNSHIELFQKLFNNKINSLDYEKTKYFWTKSFDIYSTIWDFQYIFREHYESLSNDIEISKKLKNINNFVDNSIEEIITKSQKKIFKADKKILAIIIETILLIGRYWLHFSKQKYPKLSNKKLRKKGIELMLNSIHPYLKNKERNTLVKLFKTYN